MLVSVHHFVVYINDFHMEYAVCPKLLVDVHLSESVKTVKPIKNPHKTLFETNGTSKTPQ